MSVSRDEDLLQATGKYVEMGLPVIPLCPPDHKGVSKNHAEKCQRPGKAPLIQNWQRFASTLPSLEEVKEWWTRWPTANIGGPTGPHWGLALDIDSRHNGDLEVRGTDRPIPDTITNLTGGGGTHHLFRFPGEFSIKNHVGLFPGVDVRGIGGQIVLPPSVPVSGNAYHWEGGFEPGEFSLAEAPDWLIHALKKNTGGQSNSAKASGSVFDGVSEGQRNDAARQSWPGDISGEGSARKRAWICSALGTCATTLPLRTRNCSQ